MWAYRLTTLSAVAPQPSARRCGPFCAPQSRPQHKCVVLTNGIDTAEFVPAAGRRASMRVEMGAGTEFIWITAGRIVPAKDFPNLLRAFALVRAACPEAQLWIAGEWAGAKVRRAGGFVGGFCGGKRLTGWGPHTRSSPRSARTARRRRRICAGVRMGGYALGFGRGNGHGETRRCDRCRWRA